MSWTHEPRLVPLAWVLAAFPFTIWDTFYIFLRPYTLPGNKWHEPFFKPMARWATVDHIYGEEGWLKKEGFTEAQGVINMVEVILCVVYFGIAWRGTKGFKKSALGRRQAAWAVLLGFGTGVVTATKIALYFMREVFSDYEYTRHNTQHPCLTLWGFMNLLYITVSLYMIIIFGKEILDGLSIGAISTPKPNEKRP